VEAVYIASEAAVAVQPLAGAAVVESDNTGAPLFDAGSGGRALPPGGYPRPKHPPGVFVPLKTQRSLWVLTSILVTAVAVAAAGYAGYLAVTLSQ
jgi:hypothetical protein